MSALTTAETETNTDFKVVSRQLAEIAKLDTLGRAPRILKAYLDRLENEMPDMPFGDATKGVRTMVEAAGLNRPEAHERVHLPTINVTIFGEGGNSMTAEVVPPKDDVIDVAAWELQTPKEPEAPPLPPLAAGDLPGFDLLFNTPAPA